MKDRIADFVGHDGTGTQIGMKWGLALLSEDTQPLMQQLALQGRVPGSVANRPYAIGDSSVQKIVVLMTDGRIRYQQSIKPQFYDTQEEIESWAFSEDQLACCSGGNLYAKNQLSRHGSKANLTSSSLRNNDEAYRRQQFGALCTLAREKGIRVYTIGFDISDTSTAYDDMSACATTPADFFDVDGLELFDAFSQITVDIQKLKTGVAMSAVCRAMRGVIRKLWTDQSASGTTEFVIIFPAVLFFIFAFIEVGTLSTRVVMMERGLDIAVRELRLGAFPSDLPADETHELIKDRVCDNAHLLSTSCRENLLIELTAVPLGGDLPDTPTQCRDRTEEVEPVISINMGDRANAESEIMLIRACIVVDPIFPMTGVGAGLPLDASGGYAVAAQSAFLNEPE